MKDLKVGDPVRVVANCPNAVSYVGSVGLVEDASPHWVEVSIQSSGSREVKMFDRSEVAPLRWNVEVRKVEDRWYVYSRSMASGLVEVDGGTESLNAAMDYARQLATRINGWAK